MSSPILRVGIAGLGGAGSKLLSGIAKLEDIELAAAADVRPDARAAFAREFDRPAYASVAEMCRSPEINAVYVATPTHLHCEHTLEAIRAGKHVLCEKPLATTLEDCDRMIEAARQAGVLLVQGHSKILDSAVQAIRRVIDSGRLGRVFQLSAWNFNDWMRRPRLESELDTRSGGGVVLRQGPQLVDMARFLIGSSAASVRAVAGRHAPGLPTEGDYSALITFAGGASASLVFNGYGFFDLASLIHPEAARNPQRALRTGSVMPTEKYREPALQPKPLSAQASPHSELVTVSCEKGVIVKSGASIVLHVDSGAEAIPLPADHGRAAGLAELRDAVRQGRPGFPDGAWARTTVEICLAMLDSSRLGREIQIGH